MHIAKIMLNKRTNGNNLFSHLFLNKLDTTSDLYLSESLEIISILRGNKKASITAWKAATSDKNFGLGVTEIKYLIILKSSKWLNENFSHKKKPINIPIKILINAAIIIFQFNFIRLIT